MDAHQRAAGGRSQKPQGRKGRKGRTGWKVRPTKRGRRVERSRSLAASRARPSRARPSRARPSRTRPSRARPSRARPSRARPSRARPSRSCPRLSARSPCAPCALAVSGSDRPPRYRVTGGAGFLGINLARHPLARGDAVISLDRAAVDRAMEGADVVVHAAAALPLYPREEILSTGVEGTRAVLDAAGARRVIYISSTAVYGIPDHHPIDESAPLRGVGPYGEAKVLAEGLCVAQRARGQCVTILRPRSFVGPERLGSFSLLYDRAASGKSFPLPGGGHNRYQLLDVEDLCDAICLAANADASAASDTLNAGAREFATLREAFQAVLDRAGFGRRVVALPAAPRLAALRALEALRLSPLYHRTYGTVTADSDVSVEKAARVLGFAPRHSNRDALLRNFAWYLAHRERFAGSFGVSHRTPWKPGALRLAKALF